MLTRDLDRLLAVEISALRPSPPAITTAGTWAPAPPGSAPAPGTYATPIAFRLADSHPVGPLRIAMTLAAALRRADWVCAATVTGGYVTVTVTPDALAALAPRITAAGAACARSTALAGTAVPAPPAPDLAAATSWADARRRLAAFLTGRLAEVAGARIFPSEPAEREAVLARRPGPATGPVAAAIEFAGPARSATRSPGCRPAPRPRWTPAARRRSTSACPPMLCGTHMRTPCLPCARPLTSG